MRCVVVAAVARPVKYTNRSAWAMRQGLFHGASGFCVLVAAAWQSAKREAPSGKARNASRFALCALLFALCAAATAAEQPGSPPQPEWLTNLFQLRHCAEQAPAVVHPFRIVAEVCEADSASGVLVLRDPSGVEFIRLDLQDRVIEPGATVCLEGRGYGLKPRSFGLAVVSGTVGHIHG